MITIVTVYSQRTIAICRLHWNEETRSHNLIAQNNDQQDKSNLLSL